MVIEDSPPKRRVRRKTSGDIPSNAPPDQQEIFSLHVEFGSALSYNIQDLQETQLWSPTMVTPPPSSSKAAAETPSMAGTKAPWLNVGFNPECLVIGI